ncbi:MAG: iron-sulfur cluster assembly scaffold protein [Acidobacteria bacterium]|nr:iron-sulfur cluster assembly scaffold protein [Acidobacteriota bacterium]
MYSQKLLDHFQNPRNTGELEPPAQTVEVMNPVCGDILRVSVLWDRDVVKAVRYKARGCTASIATGSALSEWMEGRSRAELAGVTAEVIEEAVGGLSAESKHAAVLAVDAVRRFIRASG